MSSRRLLGERVAVRVTGCSSRDGVLISGVKKETKFIQRFHVRFPNGDVRSHRGDQILLRGSRAPLTEFVRVGDIIFTKRTLGVVRFVGHHEEFPDAVIVMESFDPKLPTDPNVKSFRKLFPSANLSDQNSYNILTKSGDILKMLPPDNILQQISKIKDKYLAFVEERKQKDKEYSDELAHADSRISQLQNIQAQLRERIETNETVGVNSGNEPTKSSVTLTFEPGRLGIKAVWTTGKVEGVTENTQAEDAGIQPGWVITHVDDEPYAEEVLDAHTEGSNAYTLTFKVLTDLTDLNTKAEKKRQPALPLPSFNEIEDNWGKNPNEPAERPGLSPEAKEEYEQKIKELSVKIDQSQDLVMALEARNVTLEEEHKEITTLRVKVEHFRNSRVMFMSQIKRTQNEGKDWRKKAMEFERKYQALLEQQGRGSVKSKESSPPGSSKSGGKRRKLDKDSPLSGGSTIRKKPSRMPKPEPGNTVSLMGIASNVESKLKDKAKKRSKRGSWFKK